MRRRLWILVPAVLLLVLGVVAGRYVQINQEANAIFAKPDLRYGIMIRTPSMKRVADQRRETILNHAKMLREKWRPWAEANRGLLVEAKNSDGSSQAAQKLYEALPDGIGERAKMGKITHAMLTPNTRTFEDLLRPDIVLRFTWNVTPHRLPTSNVMAWQKKDFASSRRFSVSSSSNPGRAKFDLWTDGRLTESIAVDNDKPGQPSIIAGTPVEIMPPYEFIK